MENNDIRFAELTRFAQPFEAYTLMTKLEAEGIPHQLMNGNILTNDPLLSVAVGGARLIVPEMELERARTVLAEFNQRPAAEPTPIDTLWKHQYVYVDAWCPQCDTYGVYKNRIPWYKNLASALLVLVGFHFSFLVRTHRCAQCGHIWKR